MRQAANLKEQIEALEKQLSQLTGATPSVVAPAVHYGEVFTQNGRASTTIWNSWQKKGAPLDWIYGEKTYKEVNHPLCGKKFIPAFIHIVKTPDAFDNIKALTASGDLPTFEGLRAFSHGLVKPG